MPKAIGPNRIGRLLKESPLSLAAKKEPADGQACNALIPEALRARVSLHKGEDTLLILVENSAVAQIMRFHAPGLAAQQGYLKWKVKVSTVPTGVGENKLRPVDFSDSECNHPPLTATTRQCLQATADSLKNPELKASLLRLANS